MRYLTPLLLAVFGLCLGLASPVPAQETTLRSVAKDVTPPIGPGMLLQLSQAENRIISATARLAQIATCHAEFRLWRTVSGTETCLGLIPCDLPWTGQVIDQASVTAYRDSAVPFGSTCQSETRTCDNGTLSGTYTNQTCTVSPPSSCILPWGGALAHGASVNAYANAGSCGGTCTPQTRTCFNGTLSGTYTSPTCSSACASCNLPWGGTIVHGGSTTAYGYNSVPYGSNCNSYVQVRSCSNGTLSGTYQYGTCSVAAPASCTMPWGATIAHGAAATAYAVSSGASCPSESRTCTNGSLYGSYQYSACTVVVPTCVWSPCLNAGARGYLCPISHNPNCPGWNAYGPNAYGQYNWVNF